ncbi:MAG: PstS family phosphate ABC transporter substrate-binding protein [Cyanobacteria bacterium J06639_1]
MYHQLHRFALLVLAILMMIDAGGARAQSSQNSRRIAIDGSSTVFPISRAIAEDFQTTPEGSGVEMDVEFSGTSGGFRKFCAGETDINDASRPISMSEIEACRRSGIEFIELPVAFDALTVVVNPQNDWAEELSMSELRRIWTISASGDRIENWQQIRPEWPELPLEIYGPGEDSGTYDYFVEAAIGDDSEIREDYITSEDDSILVEFIRLNPNAIGYFGLAYFEANRSALKAVAIDNGSGGVLPARETVENGQYQPFSRPLFIYVNAEAADAQPELKAFVSFYLENAASTAARVGYVPLPEAGYQVGITHFEALKVGSIFDEDSSTSISIEELIRRQEALD